MTPIAVEEDMTNSLGNIAAQNGSNGGSIPLSLLIEFIIQRTYHELQVMTELLPGMSDREKKIQIYNYADRTRLLFIRLLALVKWANSLSKVDKSNRIVAFSEKQSMLFIDTADLLARISRESVVRARLPTFHMPSAIEILTTGTYARVPACVKRVVPNEPILPSERRTVILKLNQVIQHRLVASNLLPQMRNLEIANGRVTFHVKNEFDVSLTVMGDAPNIPWTLLDFKILVKDSESQGEKLVHGLQLRYILEVLQCRIAVSNDPLKEVYVFLHYFCQSLQLEVYRRQALKLFGGRLEGHIKVVEFITGHSLTVSYWRELTARDAKSELGYTVTLMVDMQGTGKPLGIVHVPSLRIDTIPEDAPALLSEQHLCMERLLIYTIHLRSETRLTELMNELKTIVKGIECDLRGTPAVLSVSVLVPCLTIEQLIIRIDIRTGLIQCNIEESVQGYLREGYRCQQFLPELQNSLNTDRTNIPSLITDMRYWLTKQRCIKTLQHLPVTVSEQLPLMIKADLQIPIKRRMFVRFHKYRHHVLVVEMKEKDDNAGAIDYNFHIINVQRTSIDEIGNSTNNTSNESSSTENEISRLYLKVLNRTQFDPFVVTHGPFTSVLDVSLNKDAGLKRKRDINAAEFLDKKGKYSEYFIPELAHVVALCNEITPFSELAQEFRKRGIPHQGIQVEANATALSLKLLELPVPDGVPIDSVGWSGIKKSLLSVSFRSITHESVRTWAVEYVMNGTPILSTNPREQGMRRPVYFQYNMNDSESVSNLVDSFLRDWSKMVHLYYLIKDMREYYPFDKFNYSAIVSVKSYNYSELVINYGGTLKQATATFHWNTDKKAFTILFGSMGALPNAHLIMKVQLEDYLNRHQDLAQIIHILHETYSPLMSINKLPSTPQLNIEPNRPLSPVLNIVTIAQSLFVVRVVYQGTFCLEINLCSDGLVSIRDAACSKFDRSIAVSEYVPTGGLKAFLSRYEDERSVLRRQSRSEDDNPPSPIRNESVDSPSGFLSHHRGPQSPSIRFHTPMTPPSNPHTPASPHPGSVQQPNQTHQTFPSTSAATFNLASPPSLSSTNINPSPTMPHPSPGSNLLASSPSNPSIYVPSPMMNSPGPNVPVGHSPTGAFLTQGHSESSPFPSQSMASPGAANWPSSPMPRPSPARLGQSPGGYPALHSPEQMKSVSKSSRVLPQKQWAGAVPTLLSHEALEVLCSPSPHPQLMVNCELSPFERFLGCVSLKRHMQRALQCDESSTMMKNVTTENGQLNFKTDSNLQCLVSMNIDHFQSLHIKVGNLPEIKDIWSEEDLRALEQFFDCRVATPPYKSPAVYTFCKMLQCNPVILNDLIQIMKLDLTRPPTILHQQQTTPLNWNVQICLTSSLSAILQSPTPFYIANNKILFYQRCKQLETEILLMNSRNKDTVVKYPNEHVPTNK